MADYTAMTGSSGIAPDIAKGDAAAGCRAPRDAAAGCRAPKLAVWVLAGLIALAAAAVLASSVPRGHRGRRRLRRPRPWHRARSHTMAPPTDPDGVPPEPEEPATTGTPVPESP